MENTETSAELLDNVVISDGPTPQYMIQRIPENSQLLGTELLQHHNGLVVDLAGTDFIPVSYPSEALLSHDLTEEDRNLAAALVAVQFSQHQKQQQVQEANLQSLVQNTAIENKILGEQQLILTDKEGVNNGYLQIVGSDNIYIGKQSLPKIITNRYVSQNFNSEKSEDEKRGSDGDHRTSRKSLPHKKRISRKLKKQNPVKVQCSLCEQTFASNDDFAQHEILCQTTITPVHNTAFSCQICSESFQDQLKFFEHLKAHYEPSQVHKTEIQDNDKDNIFSSLLNLTCIQCNKTFRRQKAIEAHMKEVHQKEEMNEFSETEDLMEGINVVVDPNDANSDNDSKAWYGVDELHQTEEDLRELEGGGDGGESEHVCHICKQPFLLRAVLLQHLITCRAATGNTEPTAPGLVKRKNQKKGTMNCRECDRVFTHRNSLVYHMRSHSGIRPHQCDQCGKSFFASSALKVHLRLHSGDKPYHCEECGKNFRQWGDLKYHMTSIHSNEKQFQCEYCGKDFARKYSLIVHRRIHTGEKNYRCEFCGKTFRASSYLQNHRRIHTGEKPHECSICGKPFRVRSDMKRHQKTHAKRTCTGKQLRYAAPHPTKIIKTETGSNLSEDIYELNVHENDNPESGHILGYDQEQLEAVKDGGTLYQGHQLFLVSYSTDVPIRNVDSSSTWIQTGS